MSEAVRHAFPVLERADAASWIRPAAAEIRPCDFRGDAAPAAPAPVSDPPAPVVELDPMAAERAELEQTRVGLERAQAALREERDALEAQREQFAQAQAELERARNRALEEADEALIDLAVGIAGALLDRALEREPALYERLAKVAIATLDDPGCTELRASPASYERLVEALGAPELQHRGAAVPVVLDETLYGDGFVAATEKVTVDGRIAPRLDAVRDALRHELRTGGAS